METGERRRPCSGWVEAPWAAAARTGGDPGPYGVVCMVFGVSYGLALAVIRRRG
ncbi:MAG: hypothetical protein ABI595_09455 [Actinomycetota bacterium]